MEREKNDIELAGEVLSEHKDWFTVISGITYT
jgi:hypothetical protein